MINEPPHAQTTTKSFDVRQSPADPGQLLITIVLMAATGLSAAEVDVIRERVMREGLKIYVSGTVENEMLTAMRLELARAEYERDSNRTRADHYEAECRKRDEYIKELEDEADRARRTYGFLAQGLPRA